MVSLTYVFLWNENHLCGYFVSVHGKYDRFNIMCTAKTVILIGQFEVGKGKSQNGNLIRRDCLSACNQKSHLPSQFISVEAISIRKDYFNLASLPMKYIWMQNSIKCIAIGVYHAIRSRLSYILSYSMAYDPLICVTLQHSIALILWWLYGVHFYLACSAQNVRSFRIKLASLWIYRDVLIRIPPIRWQSIVQKCCARKASKDVFIYFEIQFLWANM